ncbi:unnamed protein product [Tilletia controversa]|nr:unnamed protein product [Tilletia controversa]
MSATNASSDPPAVILLDSDGYSPMARPSNLPALHYKRALAHLLTEPDAASAAAAEESSNSRKKPKTPAERVEAHLRQRGWESTWRFGMYKHAHYHSTTHELLTVLTGTSSILLGGRKASSSSSSTPVEETPAPTGTTKQEIHLEPGDILILPAGYTHEALSHSPDFLLVGSYPEGSAPWDMKFPENPTECDKVSEVIAEASAPRAPLPDDKPSTAPPSIRSPLKTEAKQDEAIAIDDDSNDVVLVSANTTTHNAPIIIHDDDDDDEAGHDDEEMEVSQAEIQWMWTADEYDEWTPSRVVGLTADAERANRYAGVKFIYQMQDRLHLFGHILHSASIYFHRFFLRKPMKTNLTEPGAGYDPTEIAVACIFLACKNEEQHRKLGMIIEAAIATVSYNSGARNPLGQNTPDNFRRWRDTIIAFEDELFPTLCADLVIEQPEAMFIEACQIFDVGREQIYTGVCMLHDLDRDVYCSLISPNVQAAAVFLLVHLAAGIKLDEYRVPEEMLPEPDVGGRGRKAQQQQLQSGEADLWQFVFYCHTEDVNECVQTIRNFYSWRRATVDKTQAELAVERERRTLAQQQQSSAAAAAASSPRRPMNASSSASSPVVHAEGQEGEGEMYYHNNNNGGGSGVGGTGEAPMIPGDAGGPRPHPYSHPHSHPHTGGSSAPGRQTRWDTPGRHLATQPPPAAEVQGPLSPEMPPDEDDLDEGAVDGDV